MSELSPNARLAASRFATQFVPRWYDHMRDPLGGGVFERMDAAGRAVKGDTKTSLVQARTVFTLAHLYNETGNSRLLDAARDVHAFLDDRLRDADGGYRFADGGAQSDAMRRTYDQSFALLALVTLRRADPAAVPQSRIDRTWAFIANVLTDASDNSLWEDDEMAREGAGIGALRGQNPHMHMLEALLQAFAMTREAVWLERARPLLEVARERFVDPSTGAVREFVGPDLAPLDNAACRRREPGHQYEWAWLIHRHAALSGESQWLPLAAPMVDFAERHGLRDEGPLAGAPYDAVDADGHAVETTHLLWPLTEAGKLYAALFAKEQKPDHAAKASRAATLVFDRFFPAANETGLSWVNQLSGTGDVVWAEGLTRLLYHVALLVTEGARAGLWPVEPVGLDRPTSTKQERKP
ncbi:AGE family epimerase/isomerase [Mesorhizobium xinjiangense]|uniref:AGE family epimerase/isomerase n=1 Tax=Mesorhizobium xinjiangense TaxID=2678685 RepID=UPI0012EDBCB5|nr:AGE family epimerase/isomerase [Mesorhizobium xinjiangense]